VRFNAGIILLGSRRTQAIVVKNVSGYGQWIELEVALFIGMAP